ncbi:helix-turn-helix transcriptional regulator [Rhodococcus sp. D2-41]|uniref:LuxR C-terminal-related transcriptional regulator n=1 Tax=Speluncibacter jeojiensis TaxID=2710754 RepID=A0A9X4M705_9ACTN|nr:LuxR C-terminal-related transcriptional regulator [Rhodococcus sp. D2-41]MDG3009469.1 helix-turn-helix transcriptional regulator [Rhodococcus sp. D2-41]MDG3016398.1 LuxR C-terminal-related transcriptional regulator [Corynebacteriales bacterium D3-21]
MSSLPGAALAQAAAEIDGGDPVAADLSLARSLLGRRTATTRLAEQGIRIQRCLWGGEPTDASDPSLESEAPADCDESLRAHQLLGVGWTRLVRGERVQATADLEGAVALARSAGCDRAVMAGLSALAMVAIAGDTLAAMDEHSRTALEFAGTHGLQGDPTAVTAHQVAAWVAHQRCDTDAATVHVTAAEQAAGSGTYPAVHTLTAGLKAVIALDRAERPYGSSITLHGVLREMDWSRMPDRATACALLIQVQIALRVGEIAWARESLALAENLIAETMETELIRIILHLQRGRLDTARDRVRLLLRGAVPALTMRAPVDCVVLSATLAEAAGDHPAAHRGMAHALELAVQDRLIRPFRDGGPVVAAVLAAGMGRFGHQDDFAGEVLAKLEGPDTPHTVLLTTRELELLAELPSMRTTEEIAESLYVSVNTVKTHLRSIYRKMDVRSRREAVDTARTIGLL